MLITTGRIRYNFNSRSHVESDIILLIFNARTKNFNSRSHVESDVKLLYSLFHRCISIHALTWRATDSSLAFDGRRFISIHALTWRATAHGCII